MFSKIIFVITAFPALLVIFSSSHIKTSSHVSDPLGRWVMSPTVEICKRAPILSSEVVVAVDTWRDLGYSLIDIIVETPGSSCETGNVGGKIIIELDENVSNPQTHLMVTEGEIKWARIKLPGSVRNRVIEHEIGHAVGWNHNDILGHIMNGSYDLGGDSYKDMRIGPGYRPPPKSFPGARGPRRGTGRD